MAQVQDLIKDVWPQAFENQKKSKSSVFEFKVVGTSSNM